MEWAFWVAFAVIAVLALWRMAKVERGRLQSHLRRCKAAAAAMGASFTAEPPQALLAKLGGFDLTYADGEALPRSVRDVFQRGQDEGQLYIFLHERPGTNPGGIGGRWRRETVACHVSGRWRLPRFRLSPERVIEKLAAAFGVRDLDVEGYPGFSSAYYLNAKDEAAVRNLFGADVVRFFESHPGWHVEANGDTLLVYRNNQAVGLDQVPRFIETVEAISRLIRR